MTLGKMTFFLVLVIYDSKVKDERVCCDCVFFLLTKMLVVYLIEKLVSPSGKRILAAALFGVDWRPVELV